MAISWFVIWRYTLYRDQYRLVWSVIAVFFALLIVAMVLQFQCFLKNLLFCIAIRPTQAPVIFSVLMCRPILFHLPAKLVCFADVYRIGQLLEMFCWWKMHLTYLIVCYCFIVMHVLIVLYCLICIYWCVLYNVCTVMTIENVQTQHESFRPPV